MMNPSNYSALRQYRTMGLQGVVDEASPHELVRLLLDGGLARVAAAKGQIARREVAAKGESIGRAIGIIEGLRTSLDREAGGAVANQLESLYDYMVRRLAVAIYAMTLVYWTRSRACWSRFATDGRRSDRSLPRT